MALLVAVYGWNLASSQTIIPAHMINADPPFHGIIGLPVIFVAWFLAQLKKDRKSF